MLKCISYYSSGENLLQGDPKVAYLTDKFDRHFIKVINEHYQSYMDRFENKDDLAIGKLFDINFPDAQLDDDGHRVGVVNSEVTSKNFPILEFDAVLYNNQVLYIDVATKELNILTGYTGNFDVQQVKLYLDSINTDNPKQKLFCAHDIKSKIIYKLATQLADIITGTVLDLRKLYKQALLREYVVSETIPIHPTIGLRIYRLLVGLFKHKQEFKCTADLQEWQLGLNHIFALLQLNTNYNIPVDDLKLYNCARAINFFKKQQLTLSYSFGDINLSNKKTQNSLNKIRDNIVTDIKKSNYLYYFILLKLSVLDKETERVKFRRTLNSNSSKYTIQQLILDIPILANVLYTTFDKDEIVKIICLDDNRVLQEIESVLIFVLSRFFHESVLIFVLSRFFHFKCQPIFYQILPTFVDRLEPNLELA